MNVDLANKLLFFSKYVYLFEKKDTVAWYHSLTIKTLFLEKTVSDIIIRIKQKHNISQIISVLSEAEMVAVLNAIEVLLLNHFLLEDFTEDDKLYQNVLSKVLWSPAIGIMYLIMTEKCNFACTYCFVENSLPEKYDFTIMSKDTIKKAIDLYARSISKYAGRKTIILYGGEPMINIEGIRFCLEYVELLKKEQKIPKDVAITINTNASLVTTAVAELFKKHDIAVSVSLDGLPQQHDKCRVFENGQPTSACTLEGYKKFKQAGVSTGISCTVGEHNINEMNEIVNWMINDLKIDFLGLNPLTDIKNKKLSSLEYIKRFSEISINAFEIARNKGLYEDRAMRKVEYFVHKKIYPFDCGACGRQIVVAPDGQVGVCHAYLGDRKYFSKIPIDNIDIYKEAEWKIWSRRSPLLMPQCQSCFALGLCGGGCPYNADVNNGSIGELDDNFCIYSQTMIEWMIWDLYSKIQR